MFDLLQKKRGTGIVVVNIGDLVITLSVAGAAVAALTATNFQVTTI